MVAGGSSRSHRDDNPRVTRQKFWFDPGGIVEDTTGNSLPAEEFAEAGLAVIANDIACVPLTMISLDRFDARVALGQSDLQSPPLSQRRGIVS